MRNLYAILLLAFCLVTAADAQTSTFTLDQCVDYALKNSIDVVNSKLGEEGAVERVKEITGLGMPQISGAVSITHNQQLQRFFGRNIDTLAHPKDFGFFRSIDGANDGDIVAGQNFFQLKSAGNAGLTINQLVFNGSYFVGLQAAKGLKQLSVKQTNQTKAEVVDKVSKAFYLALINRERIALFNSNIGRVDTLLRNTRALNANGFAENIDVDRLQVAYNNLITEKEKFVNLQALSIELLKFQMNYPMDSPLDILGDIAEIDPSVNPTEYKKDWDYQARPDYQVLETNRDLQLLNIKNFKAQALPTIGLFANLGYSTQSPNIGGLFKTNTPVADNGFVGPDKWYPYSMYGLQMNIPLFSGFQLHHKVQQEKINLAKIENSMKQVKSGIDLEIKNSLVVYQNAIKTMQSQKENMELSSKVARVTKIKYEQGVGSNIEVLDAENTLKESQVNYYNALYDALVAKVNLDKAYGKLLTQTESN